MERTVFRSLQVFHAPSVLDHDPILKLPVLLLQVSQVPLRLPDLVVESLLNGLIVGGLSHRPRTVDQDLFAFNLSKDILQSLFGHGWLGLSAVVALCCCCYRCCRSGWC